VASLTSKAIEAVRSILGVSEYDEQAMRSAGRVTLDKDDPIVLEARARSGGQLALWPIAKTQWFGADVEDAENQADLGRLELVGQLANAMQGDGLIYGLLGTRTGGLIGLPREIRGNDPNLVAKLSEPRGARSLFDEMHPPAELAMLSADGIVCGYGLGELVPVEGRDHPTLVRLDPTWLYYQRATGQWLYQTVAGLIEVTPGDGRWVLHLPGGRLNPWRNGAWRALGPAYVRKVHANLARDNYGAKLANPARVAYAPNGATENQRVGMLSRLMAWGINTVIELPAGWEAKLLESNGRGSDVFEKQIAQSDMDIMITLAGQVVSVTGGTGFANTDLHQTIRADLIQQTADALAYTCNTQTLPQWTAMQPGADVLNDSPRVRWDTRRPSDRKEEATAFSIAGNAVGKLNEVMRPDDLRVDMAELAERYRIPTVKIPAQPESSETSLDLAPTDVARVVTADEGRASRGLPPIGDERGDQTIGALKDSEGKALDGDEQNPDTDDSDE
jgi:hypothetical protein